jgi:predicted nucleic acid-binding protein
MRFFFDTSVLIPCFFENHVHHEASLRAFLEVEKQQGSCGAHTLAEFYANATGFPGKNRMRGDQALLVLDQVRDRLAIVALTPEEYYFAISDSAAAGILGGTIYDALLCRCAEKVGAELIYTWNVRHFQQFSEGITKRIRTP